MPFQIIRSDITRVRADAIVNTANPRPLVGGGTDSAVYAAAGADRLLAARREIGEILPGRAASTPAFALDARYIIHTVGPVWVDGTRGEGETLRACYENALALAEKLGCASVAFPLIATGTYGFPRDQALRIALSAIGSFLLLHEMTVILVVFDRRALELSQEVAGGIEQYIDDHTVRRLREKEYGGGTFSRRREAARVWEDREVSFHFANGAPSPDGSALNAPTLNAPAGADLALPLEEAAAAPGLPPAAGRSLEEVVGQAGETFQQRLFRLIDASGMDDVTVYKKANIDRKVFSRIRCKADYKPKKKTALAFAIALELDMQTVQDLLSRAEIALSPSSKFDLIVSYFISNGIYDIFQINAALFKYGQPVLGE